jgi:hypothetical protein
LSAVLRAKVARHSWSWFLDYLLVITFDILSAPVFWLASKAEHFLFFDLKGTLKHLHFLAKVLLALEAIALMADGHPRIRDIRLFFLDQIQAHIFLAEYSKAFV